MKNSFAGACRRAGFNDFIFHDLRHTFSSHLVMSGVGPSAVQKLLGRAGIKMTMWSAHLSKGHRREAVAALKNLPGAKEMLNFPPENEKEVNAKTLTS